MVGHRLREGIYLLLREGMMKVEKNFVELEKVDETEIFIRKLTLKQMSISD